MKMALVITTFLIAAVLRAGESEVWGNAVFDSAAQAYAFATDHAEGSGQIVARVVVRTDGRNPHFIVFFTSAGLLLRPQPTPVAFKVLEDSGGALWLYFGTDVAVEPLDWTPRKGVLSYGGKWIVWWIDGVAGSL